MIKNTMKAIYRFRGRGMGVQITKKQEEESNKNLDRVVFTTLSASGGSFDQFAGFGDGQQPKEATVTADLKATPPKRAEYLAYLFLPRTNRENLLGDLTEEYPSIVAKFGKRGAQVYFYKQVVWSIWPLVKNSVIKWGLFGWVVELIRRIGS